jgi:hypothetical protein
VSWGGARTERSNFSATAGMHDDLGGGGGETSSELDTTPAVSLAGRCISLLVVSLLLYYERVS